MGTVHETKYGPIEIPKDTQPGEPGFLLRGQDALAPLALEAYAGLLEAAAQAAINEEETRRLQAMAVTVRDQAEAMRDWQHPLSSSPPHLVQIPD